MNSFESLLWNEMWIMKKISCERDFVYLIVINKLKSWTSISTW
jgi:hypothetical protein